MILKQHVRYKKNINSISEVTWGKSETKSAILKKMRNAADKHWSCDGTFKDCINDEKQFVSASVLYSTLHLNVFGPINTGIDKDSQYIYQLYRLSTLSHWTLDLPTVLIGGRFYRASYTTRF